MHLSTFGITTENNKWPRMAYTSINSGYEDINMIMQRHANNDFDALIIADAMESVGANVFSITNNGMRKNALTSTEYSTFIVWAKTQGEDMIKLADEAIDRAFEDL